MRGWLDFIALLLLFLLNGVFAMSEIAMVASRKARLEAFAERGRRGARRALSMRGDPTTALSTIQVGITSIGILSGIVGESALAAPIARALTRLGLPADVSGPVAVAVVVVVVTYFSIVLGELVPKRIGQLNAEGVFCLAAGPLRVLSLVMSPFVRLLSVSTEFLLRLSGFSGRTSESVTEEEIHAILREGSESGVIDSSERDMVRNVFRLDDRQVGSLMTPRNDIEWIDLRDSEEENFRKVLGSGRSRLPVGDGSLDDIKGICTTRTVLRQIVDGGKPDFLSGLAPASYVPESLSGMELLEQFKGTDMPLSLVVDEYGAVVGLVTPRDLLEAIAGEFKPATSDDAWALPRGDGSWVLDGIIPVPELKDCLRLKSVPEEELGHYNTLSGMMMVLLERLPKTGDVVRWEGWRFEITRMDGRRIDKVLATASVAGRDPD